MSRAVAETSLVSGSSYRAATGLLGLLAAANVLLLGPRVLCRRGVLRPTWRAGLVRWCDLADLALCVLRRLRFGTIPAAACSFLLPRGDRRFVSGRVAGVLAHGIQTRVALALNVLSRLRCGTRPAAARNLPLPRSCRSFISGRIIAG
jgi:hypothetical protein